MSHRPGPSAQAEGVANAEGAKRTGGASRVPETASGVGAVRSSQAARNCFVCGPDNPVGLRLEFRLEKGACVSEFTPGEDHVGYPGVVHGGMIYSALDDVMANWLYLQGARAYTARCEIRYREPAGVGDALRLVGRPESRKRNWVKMKATASRMADGKVVADADATFVIINEAEFADVGS